MPPPGYRQQLAVAVGAVWDVDPEALTDRQLAAACSIALLVVSRAWCWEAFARAFEGPATAGLLGGRVFIRPG